MTHPEPYDPNQYVTDILDLHMRLDDVAVGDDSQRITSALIQGKEQYFDLVFRRLFLDFRPKDTAVVLWMLDIIQARLAALERLHRQKSVTSGVDTSARKSRLPVHGPASRRTRCTG
ncbi:MAG TPA: hypothetical protein VJU82_01340 [Acidobacteriaceae bacterium]|nr:hypothetical protein [Acidobacteriaceae bacterium]